MIVHQLSRKILGVALFTLVAVGLYLFLLTKTGVHSPFQKRIDAYVTIPDAYELVPNSDVRQAGVLIGDVSSVKDELTSRGVVSKVGISLDPGHVIYRNATVQLRTKTLANENYLQLDPGTPSAGRLPQGGGLGLAHARESVQLDQVLDTFTPATRQQLQSLIDTSGAGLAGQGENLNHLFGAADPLSQRGEQVLGLLDAQHTEVADIVADTASVLSAFANRTQAVRGLATEAQSAAQAAASRDAQIVAALHALPSTLDQVKTTLTRLGRFAGTATPVVDNLTSVTRQATPVLADLRPTAQATRTLVKQLPGALSVAKPLLGQLTPFTRKLTPTVDALSDFLRQGDPLLSYLGPYSQEFGAFFADNGGAIGQHDAAGYIGRVFPIFADSSVTGTSTLLQNAIAQLDGIAKSQVPLSVKVNPYPKPGTNGDPQPFSGTYPRLLPLAPTPARSSRR